MASPDYDDDEDTKRKDRIVQSIYDHLVTSVCIDFASNMHELIKTGKIPISELTEPFSRQEIYPELYEGKDPEEIQATLEKYATEVPNPSRKRKFSPGTSKQAAVDKDDTEEYKEESSEVEPAAESTTQTQQAVDYLDIWGRIPPKEPKQLCLCQICGRQVSTLRFAPHLDKCMGLSTRPTTANFQRNSSNTVSSFSYK